MSNPFQLEKLRAQLERGRAMIMAMIKGTQTTILILVVVVCAVGLGFVMGAVELSEKHLGYSDAFLSVGSSILTTGAAYIFAFTLFKHFKDVEQSVWFDKELKPLQDSMDNLLIAIRQHDRELLQVSSTPWNDLIQGADEIDFVVQSWPTWMDYEGVQESMTRFFSRGGRVNLFVNNYDSAYESVLHRSMLSRMPGKNIQVIVNGIKLTIAKLFSVLEGANTSKVTSSKTEMLSVFLMNRTSWYCAIRFRPNRLLLSPYAHCSAGVKTAPTLIIQTANHPGICNWFEKEIEHLKDNSNSTQLNSSEFKKLAAVLNADV